MNESLLLGFFLHLFFSDRFSFVCLSVEQYCYFVHKQNIDSSTHRVGNRQRKRRGKEEDSLETQETQRVWLCFRTTFFPDVLLPLLESSSVLFSLLSLRRLTVKRKESDSVSFLWLTSRSVLCPFSFPDGIYSLLDDSETVFCVRHRMNSLFIVYHQDFLRRH